MIGALILTYTYKNLGNRTSNLEESEVPGLAYRNADPVEFFPRALAPPIVSPAAKLACFARSDRASGETLCSRTRKIPKGLLILYASPGTSDPTKQAAKLAIT